MLPRVGAALPIAAQGEGVIRQQYDRSKHLPHYHGRSALRAPVGSVCFQLAAKINFSTPFESSSTPLFSRILSHIIHSINQFVPFVDVTRSSLVDRH